jgi:hypothetical protein
MANKLNALHFSLSVGIQQGLESRNTSIFTSRHNQMIDIYYPLQSFTIKITRDLFLYSSHNNNNKMQNKVLPDISMKHKNIHM